MSHIIALSNILSCVRNILILIKLSRGIDTLAEAPFISKIYVFANSGNSKNKNSETYSFIRFSLSCSLSLLYCISDILYGFSNK